MSDNPTDNVPNTTLSGLVATLIPTLLISLVYVGIFLCLRRSQRRFYAPRTYLGSLREEDRTVALPNGWFNWITPFWKIPDEYALQHQSLDAYLFLRYLRMCVLIMAVGTCITWPILFPVNATGGGGGKQLDMLSMSNVNKDGSGKYRYFAHTFVAWIFFSFVLFLITRESIFYINLRQAFLLSPIYANRISARTVLFTAVPTDYLDEARLRKVFGDTVQRIWIQRDAKEVTELVEERDKVAFRLEAAEVTLIKTANGERLKALKKNKGGGTFEDEHVIAQSGDTESGSIASRWIPDKMRPTHKLGLLGLFGEKVDTINWSRTRLETLIPQTEAAQAAYRAGETKEIGAVFIEFAHQSDAQAAFQTLPHHQALHMAPRYIGVNPSEVVWKSLRVSWPQRVVRRLVALGFVTALVVFWAIPVAFVGLVSNITYLESFTWLHWLTKIPSQIIGIISNLLPAVALSILMSLVPIIMRIVAKLSGEVSLARVELFTQNAYFVFQVVQVFLVVTISSAASSIVAQIIHNPTGIAALLANRLPTVSNFYISYFIVQGLTVASDVISQVIGFVIFQLLYKYLSGTPRKMYTKWANLSAISWGSVLPVFTNIAVIGLTYSCIAPLVLGFATIGMSFFYLAFRYNVLFVTDSEIDTKGLIYPRALQQLFTGIYLSEICMIGLFGISASAGPLILMILFLVFTVLYHTALNTALDPLLYNLPKSLETEEESYRALRTPNASHNDEKLSNNSPIASPPSKSNIFTRFFKPHIYADYATLRALVPHSSAEPDELYSPEILENAYYPPSVSSSTPLLWIPRDHLGISEQEMQHTERIIGITDEGCTLDAETNKLIWDAEGVRPPLWEEKIRY